MPPVGIQVQYNKVPTKQKLNLERFKKTTQGLIEFAKLIEQASPKMQKSIIERTRREDPDFIEKALHKVIYFEEFIYLDDGIMAEILSVTPAKVLAYAINGLNEPFCKKVLDQVGFRTLRKIQDEQDRMGEKASKGLVLGARKHILKMARKLESQNKFVIELTDCPRLKPKRRPAA